ncbi:hypothetical protein BVRB_6g130890 [Beta vulgaris subsp. vulgaris]|nr:hypothetical protein BVRB_6g130890 [Beta vulgaris subsp. vulgaris]
MVMSRTAISSTHHPLPVLQLTSDAIKLKQIIILFHHSYNICVDDPDLCIIHCLLILR